MRRAAGPIGAAVLLACAAAAQQQGAVPAAARSAAARALAFVWAQQDADGGIRSSVHGVLKPGCSLTATALLATALLPEPLRAPQHEAIARAFAFLFERTDAEGAVGLGGDDGIDYPTYTSAHLLHALALLRPDGAGERIAQQVARLRLVQLDAGEGWSEDDAAFGAFGFGTKPEPKPLGAGLADIALQRAVLEALRAAGVGADDPTVQRARRFVARCQRLRSAADPKGDGGFVFAAEPPWRVSKAGLDAGGAHGASYGTTTADGIRALLACGATPDDPALLAARAWLGANLRFDRVPGLPGDAVPPVEPALRVYWWSALACTLRALERASDAQPAGAGERPREAPLDGPLHVVLEVPPRWRDRLCAALLPLQRADGSFVGLSDLMKEDDPLVATPLALFALAAVLDAPQPAGGRGQPAPAAGFRVVPHAELGRRRQRGATESLWTGIDYAGSDDAWHYFADTYRFATHRLAVRRDALAIDRVMPFTRDRAAWVDVGGFDLRATVLPLAAGRRRVPFALQPWRPPPPPYRAHELGPILVREPIPGSRGVRLHVDVAKAARVVDDLAAHAATWPAAFADEAQRRLAVDEAGNLSRLLGLAHPPVTTELEVLAARLAVIEHNLEQPGAELGAYARFDAVLAREPRHAEANLHLGSFLAGSSVRCRDAIACLELAAAAGRPEAWQHLAAVHLSLGDAKAAIAALQRHLAVVPSDPTSTPALAALRTGTAAPAIR